MGTRADNPGREKIRFNAADQVAARAATIRRADLRPTGGWIGGAVKPDLSSTLTCPNYHPKLSDLVLTGAARTHWSRGPWVFDSATSVLETAEMVRLDWQREVLVSTFVPCLRSQYEKNFPPSEKLVSFKQIAFPRIAPYARAYRLLVDHTAQGQTVRWVFEFVFTGRSRTQIFLFAYGNSISEKTVSAAALRLARILVDRIQA